MPKYQERSFSRYKNILADNRQMLTSENLEKHLIALLTQTMYSSIKN
jgi:hypothetical protein